MGIEKLHKALFILFISLLALGIFSIAYAVLNPGLNVINYISGSAIVVIAILTMAYVYITSKQLDVMAKQLEQIKIEREFQNQPLPYIYDVKGSVEKPRPYYSPPEDKPYSVISRYWVKFKLRNLSNSPAVCVDISARIEVASNDTKTYLYSISINIPTLEEKQNYPTDGANNSFLFSMDEEGILLQALREDDFRKLPTVTFRTLYRNILGGCFISYNKYRLYRKELEQDSVLSNWLSEIKSFWVKYKHELDDLKGLRKGDTNKWDEKFDALKEKFGKFIIGEDMELEPWQIPGTFKVSAIGEEEYKEAIEDVSYGVRLTEGLKCIVEGEKET